MASPSWVKSQNGMATSSQLVLQAMVSKPTSNHLPNNQADSLSGMPRILLSTASLTPLILAELGIEYAAPTLVADILRCQNNSLLQQSD